MDASELVERPLATGSVQIPIRDLPLSPPSTPARDSDRAERYLRHRQLAGFGDPGQARLEAARVLVVGAGGLGSAVLPYLVAAGVGTIGISDDDTVALSNLPRQIMYPQNVLGQDKAHAAHAYLAALNTAVTFEVYGRMDTSRLDAIGAHWDVIVECTDAFASKYAVADWCAANHKPLVWGSVVGLQFQTSVFWTDPPPPLPSTSLRQLYPKIPPAGTTPQNDVVGVLGPVVGQVGTIMATETIKLIVGIGTPLIGRILIGDGATQQIRLVPFI